MTGGGYSWLERQVHALAMSQLETQKLLSGLEDRIFRRLLAETPAERPVFLTSLPRAGTTLMLEILAGAPEFAAHTYRQTPFLLCPLLWRRLSKPFQRRAQPRERAHGDGMRIDYDSVEAFEEVLWRAFWPEKFRSDRIIPWTVGEEDAEGEFVAFLQGHMRKIVALSGEGAQRYVSKNNANIARLAWIARKFPDAVALIPYRNPVDHIGSLLQKHRLFLETHKQDRFALRYMESIGHLEFGQALRPIDFGGWLDQRAADTLTPTAMDFSTSRRSGLDPGPPLALASRPRIKSGAARNVNAEKNISFGMTLDFWAAYWAEAFEVVLAAKGPRTMLYSYDRLCAAPHDGLRAIAAAVGMALDALTPAAERFRPPNRYSADGLSPDLLARLRETQGRLDAAAIF